MNMGLDWVNSFGKKQWRSLFWRVKAAVKKAMKKNGAKKQLKFQYDPSSYALNFDDGNCNLGFGSKLVKSAKIQDCSENKIMWVCVLWVDESQRGN